MNTTITLADVPARYEVTPGNFIEQSADPYMVLVAGSLYEKPAAKFDHPNMAAKFNKVFEFKHCHPTRGKFWTAKAGVEMLFVVPKSKIQLNVEKAIAGTYSYVPIIVNGLEFTLNVSGGTNFHLGVSGWTDWIRTTAHTHCSWTIGNLKKLAAVAWTIQECKDNGVKVKSRRDDDTPDDIAREAKRFMELSCKSLYQGKLKTGDKLVVDASYELAYEPLTIDSKNAKRNSFIVTGCGISRYTRVKYKDVDWHKTALANGWDVPSPVNIVRVAAEQVAA